MALALTPGNNRSTIVLVGALALSTVVRHGVRRPGIPLALAIGAAVVVFTLGHADQRLLIVIGIAVVALARLETRALLSNFIDGVGVYLIANVAGYFLLGLRSPTQTARLDSALETSSGLFSERIIFPFTQSVVTPPAMAAVFLAGVTPLLLASPHRRYLRIPAALCGAVVLVAANYRVPLVLSVVLVSALVLCPRSLSRVAPGVAVAALLLPFAFTTMEQSVAQVVTVASQAIPSLERDEETSGTLNGRAAVWEETVRRQRQFEPRHLLFGFGAGGHVESGVSAGYAHLFRGGGFLNPLGAGSHNSALQQLVDGGWVGMLLLVASVAATVRRTGRWGRSDPFGLAASGMILAVAVTGATESVLAPGVNALGFSVVVITASAAAQRVRGRATSPTSVRSGEPDLQRN